MNKNSNKNNLRKQVVVKLKQSLIFNNIALTMLNSETL